MSGSSSRAGPIRSDVLWPGVVQRGPVSHPVWGKARVTGISLLTVPAVHCGQGPGWSAVPGLTPRTLPSLHSAGGDTEAHRGEALLPGLEPSRPGWSSLSDQAPDSPAGGAILKTAGFRTHQQRPLKSAFKQSALCPHGCPGCDLDRGTGRLKCRLPPCRVPAAAAALAQLERGVGAAGGSRGQAAAGVGSHKHTISSVRLA